MALEADAAALEADAIAAQLSALQALLVAAAESVCPGHADLFARPKEAVRATTTSETGPDLQCHAPATIWRRLRARAPAAEPVLITTTSEFGTRSERAYGSAAELSAAILAALPPEEASRRLADARMRADDGCLLLTTQLHWRRQRTAGLLHCTLCGAFCAGERGLQDMLRGGAQRRPDVTPDTSVAATPATDATAVAQASSAGAGSDGPLELAPKTGPRRYWLFGPREDA